MSKIADAEANATSLDGLVNDNGLIPTLRNGPKPSWQYLVDGWDGQIASKITELNKSRGFRVIGAFADGFTYELFNDVGIDTDGNSWIYTGAGAPNKVVNAGTVPSAPDYEQVTFNTASSISNANGGTVQDHINANRGVEYLKQLGTVGNLEDGQRFDVNGYYEGTLVGGGQFVWDASRSKAGHNGGTITAPEALVAWDGSQSDIASVLDWSGSGLGCFMRTNNPQELRGAGFNNPKGEDALYIFCGDSTTEQMGATGYGFDRINRVHRNQGGALEGILGTMNFGGSGNTLENFYTAPAETLPEFPPYVDAGVGQWDYYGHKPVGAVSLSTALNWREGKSDCVTWVICFGINDCILNADVGNLPEDELTRYISRGLSNTVGMVQNIYPEDKLILRAPNPMTARPYDPAKGFPSPTAYPTFGDDEADDAALVDKWNNALLAGYLSLDQKFIGVEVWNTHDRVFGNIDTATQVGENPFLGDLVHPNADGYVRLADDFVELVTPQKVGTAGRRRLAELKNTAQPWEEYALYFADNPAFNMVASLQGWIGVGSNYIDLNMSLSSFLQVVDTASPLFVSIGDGAAQEYATYQAAASGDNIRIIGVSNTTAMQSSVGEVSLYQRALNKKFKDEYVSAQVDDVAPRAAYAAQVVSAGNGYFDIRLTDAEGRMSTKFIESLEAGALIIGGGAQTTLNIADVVPLRTSNPSTRSVRFLASGDRTAYNGAEVAVVFGDDDPLPVAYESAYRRVSAVCRAAVGERAHISPSIRLQEGGVVSAKLVTIADAPTLLGVFDCTFPNRVRLGTLTIPQNQGDSNEISIAELKDNTWIEFEVEGTGSETENSVRVEFIPN